jgi:FkbM family methyltransferase
VDVGANVGYFTLLSLALGCRVTALEPQQHIVPLVKSSLALNHPSFARRVTWLPCAAADESGQHLELTQPLPGNGRDTSDWGQVGVVQASASPTPPGCAHPYATAKPAPACPTPTTGSAHYRDQYNGSSDDVLLLKIDVEGFEANVIAGSQRLLRQRQARNILLEVHEGGDALQEKVLGQIMGHGYSCLQ